MSAKIYQSMSAVMRELTAVGKDKVNKQQGFKYRGIDDFYNSVHAVLAKHSVFTTPEVLDKVREERATKSGGLLIYTMLRMKYTFWADDGSSVSCIVEGEGMDSGDKSSNKAMSIAHKYALLQTFCIPTEGIPDPDEESHDVAPHSRPQQQTRPAAKPRQAQQAQPNEDQRAMEIESSLQTAEHDIRQQADPESLKSEFARWYKWAKPIGEGAVKRVQGAYEKRKREIEKEGEPA